MVKMKCNFCKFEKEEIIYEDDKVWICETKDLKGHQRRIMVVTKEHVKEPSEELREYAIDMLRKWGRIIFKDKCGFCIMSDRHSRFPGHFHRVATDFFGNDLMQILDTEREMVWIRRPWREK